MPAIKEIVVPSSRRWPEFLSQLSRRWRCFGTTEHARTVLANMAGVDVEGSLRELALLGGTCDCVIEHDLKRELAGLRP